MIKFLKTYLTILILFVFAQGTFGQTMNPDGELQKANPEDIWAHTLSGSHFNEFWNYHFYLNDGLKVHVTFSVANFGSFKAPVSGVRVSVYNMDDDIFQISREYPLDQLVQDKENYIFKPHPDKEVFFKGNLPDEHEVRIETSKGGVSYDINLTFDNIAEGLKWGQGEFTVGNEDIGIITHIPYAEVSGNVTVNKYSKDVHGTAYMDHTYQDETTTRLMHSGYRFIHHDDPENWDLLYFLYPSSRDNNTIGYRLTNRNDEIKLQGAQRIKDMTRSRSFGETIAQEIELEFENQKTAKLTRTTDEEKITMFGELNWVQRRAARTFLGGEVLDFRGEAVLTESNKMPIRGNYNYFLVN